MPVVVSGWYHCGCLSFISFWGDEVCARACAHVGFCRRAADLRTGSNRWLLACFRHYSVGRVCAGLLYQPCNNTQQPVVAKSICKHTANFHMQAHRQFPYASTLPNFHMRAHCQISICKHAARFPYASTLPKSICKHTPAASIAPEPVPFHS